MSDSPLSIPRSSSRSKPTPSLSSFSSSSSTTASSSPFGTPKSSISRKKPLGLDISASIKPTRAAPGLPGAPGGPSDGSGSDGLEGLSEAEKLRKDIERLQLSSASSSSHSMLDSPPTSPATGPGTPPVPATTSTGTGGSETLTTSTSGGSSNRKKSSTSIGGKKKSKTDKDGLELVRDEDLEILEDLGAGNGGTVTKVWNKKRNCVMARKLILVDAKPSIRKQILRELQIMNDCSSPYIVGYYGCFPVDVHVGIVMEAMDAGSLDDIYRKNGAVPIAVVGKVAEAVLRGLMYLYDVHRIIHRDIKPSNILANTAGEIKICDFGVSGELINSIANTFVGTSTYMSPERIQGAPYTIKSDVWSLGISLIELATARFPFMDPPDSSDADDMDEDLTEHDPDATLPLATQRPKIDSTGEAKKERRRSRGVSLGGGGHTMSILDLLQHIVNEPAPRLVSSRRTFPKEAEEFVEGCLHKDPGTRKSPQVLLASDWITQSTVTKYDLKKWASTLVGSSK